MKNQVHYYVYLLCSSIYLKIAISSLVDASSFAPNGSTPLNNFESSKHKMRDELGNAKSGHSQLPNSEGEFQVLESTKLTSVGSKKRNTIKRVTKSPKVVSSSKIPKRKNSKAKDSNEVKWSSVEDDFKKLKMESDEDILRKATERTSTTTDDYEWESEDDWDTTLKKAEKNKRLFDFSLSEDDASQGEPTKKIKSRKQKTTSEQSKTTNSNNSPHQTETKRTLKSLKNSTKLKPHKNKTSTSEQKSLVLTTRVTPEPQLRGFESASVLEGESASVVDFEELDPEDYSITYVSLDSYSGDDDDDNDGNDGDDGETVQEYDDENNNDESDYIYDEDTSSDGDYIEYNDDESIRDESESVESHKTKKPTKQSLKRKTKLKNKKKWIKEEKKARKMGKQKRRKQSIDGMKTNNDEPITRQRRPGGKRDQSRATRLGFRRKMSGRHFGRNAGKEVYWRKGRKLYSGPRKRFALRGKAKVNARVYKAPKKASRG